MGCYREWVKELIECNKIYKFMFWLKVFIIIINLKNVYLKLCLIFMNYYWEFERENWKYMGVYILLYCLCNGIRRV